MIPNVQNPNQLSFYSTFEEQLDHNLSLYRFANQIRWKTFDVSLKHYSLRRGDPAKSIWLMVGLLILKQIRNLSDEDIIEQWAENPYFQYFCGETSFCSKAPCSPTELLEFRKRIGKEGVVLIFQEIIRLNGKDVEKKHLSAD